MTILQISVLFGLFLKKYEAVRRMGLEGNVGGAGPNKADHIPDGPKGPYILDGNFFLKFFEETIYGLGPGQAKSFCGLRLAKHQAGPFDPAHIYTPNFDSLE